MPATQSYRNISGCYLACLPYDLQNENQIKKKPYATGFVTLLSYR